MSTCIRVHVCVCVWVCVSECVWVPFFYFAISICLLYGTESRQMTPGWRCRRARPKGRKAAQTLCGSGGRPGRGRSSGRGRPGMPGSCSWLTYYDHLIARFNLPSFFFLCAASPSSSFSTFASPWEKASQVSSHWGRQEKGSGRGAVEVIFYFYFFPHWFFAKLNFFDDFLACTMSASLSVFVPASHCRTMAKKKADNNWP